MTSYYSKGNTHVPLSPTQGYWGWATMAGILKGQEVNPFPMVALRGKNILSTSHSLKSRRETPFRHSNSTDNHMSNKLLWHENFASPK